MVLPQAVSVKRITCFLEAGKWDCSGLPERRSICLSPSVFCFFYFKFATKFRRNSQMGYTFTSNYLRFSGHVTSFKNTSNYFRRSISVRGALLAPHSATKQVLDKEKNVPNCYKFLLSASGFFLKGKSSQRNETLG